MNSLEQIALYNREYIIRNIPSCLEKRRAEKLWNERTAEHIDKGYSRLNSFRYALDCLRMRYKNYLK